MTPTYEELEADRNRLQDLVVKFQSGGRSVFAPDESLPIRILRKLGA